MKFRHELNEMSEERAERAGIRVRGNKGRIWKVIRVSIGRPKNQSLLLNFCVIEI